MDFSLSPLRPRARIVAAILSIGFLSSAAHAFQAEILAPIISVRKGRSLANSKPSGTISNMIQLDRVEPELVEQVLWNTPRPKEQLQTHFDPIPPKPFTESNAAIDLLKRRKASEAYPHIPQLNQVHLPKFAPGFAEFISSDLSPGVVDPLLEEARYRKVFPDFKTLSDARPISLSPEQEEALKKGAEEAGQKSGRDAYLKTYIEGKYAFGSELESTVGIVRPQWKTHSANTSWNDTFAYTEKTWSSLVRKTPLHSNGSLLSSPYPILIPAGRFQELYYWDTYFGVKGLLATGRVELAQMQVENLLNFVQRFGFVPNGGRDYYLSRSQPPLLTTLVREVYGASTRGADRVEIDRLKNWLKVRAYPLLKGDYLSFWMNPATRLNKATGLNHHWDEINLPRPERHSFDKEEDLGATYRDVRAAAESGLDFTETLGFETTNTAGILLNSLMYKTEKDLAWMAHEFGFSDDEVNFKAAAASRKKSIHENLWNPESGRFENYDLKKKKRMGHLTADTFVPLFVGLATPEQARKVKKTLLTLEKQGGIMASELIHSTYQWDGTNGWAPQQVFAIQGLLNYGLKADARRLAKKWVETIAKGYRAGGVIYERMNVETSSKPQVDEIKYPPQEGFLWTNASYVWAMTQVLKVGLSPN